jgi:outer membrane lipoprotein-sorting protein
VTRRARGQLCCWTAALALLIVAACVTVPVPPTTPTPDRAAEILAAVAACADAPENFTARVRVHAVFPDGKATLRGWITVRFPASIRVELQDPLGRPRLFLVVDGGVLRVLDAARETFTEGPATAEALARWLRVPLGPEWAARILTGRVLRGGGWTLADGGEVPGIAVASRDGRWRAVLDPGDGAVLRVRRVEDGTVDLVVAYGDPDAEGGCAQPRTLTATSVAPVTELDMIYTSVEWNRPLSEGFFQLPVPDGVRVERVP